jgi:hypothetical protein
MDASFLSLIHTAVKIPKKIKGLTETQGEKVDL